MSTLSHPLSFPCSSLPFLSMSESNFSSPPVVRVSAQSQLQKQKSWSPDSSREETWLRRKGIHQDRRRMNGTLRRSVTDEDLEELRGCIDLGFRFDLDSPYLDSDPTSPGSSRLTDTFPALDMYYAVNRQYSEAMSSPASTLDSSPAGSSPLSIYSPGERPQQVKARLKQWAQVVAYSVGQQRRC